VLGLDVRRHGKEVRRLVGYVPQSIRFEEDATVEDLVDYVSDLKGVNVYLEDVLCPLGLEKMSSARVGSLSGGMRQRLAIALALIGDPKILLLDEPFNNLDPMAKNVVASTLRRQVREQDGSSQRSHGERAYPQLRPRRRVERGASRQGIGGLGGPRDRQASLQDPHPRGRRLEHVWRRGPVSEAKGAS
jgi:ABC-type transport system involved in cytochrome c biogenesis ATPase subunit